MLIGFVRPPAAASMARSLWQLGHAMLGRMALMLGMVNVFIGIYLFGTLYKGMRLIEGCRHATYACLYIMVASHSLLVQAGDGACCVFTYNCVFGQ
jgi:hypothetical protein